MNRLEYKYLVPLDRLADLRQAIRPYVETDPYVLKTGQGHYTVHSIYFDTPDLKYYYAKVEGIDIRKKVRLRSYNQPDETTILFLEIKEKNQKAVHKRRLILNWGDNALVPVQKQIQLSRSKADPRKNGWHELPFFMNLIYRDALRPIIQISYDREAYFHRFNRTLRLTFDYHLRSMLQSDLSQLFNERGTIISLPRHFIWEIKFYGGLPSWVLSLIATFQLQQQPLSKYNICLEKHLIREKVRSKIVLSNKNLLKNYLVQI